ncbi:hypothetical protein EVAR_73115_1 [Eumeta japonica]|uniref:Uncharacterized protein n=1 Tax=Eumeta variegata TaxID=151549 RepID=A0A4C1T4J8_EUMVA|nr:hypothetical protein EVAR_73115_1 [Eumeta japonica]
MDAKKAIVILECAAAILMPASVPTRRPNVPAESRPDIPGLVPTPVLSPASTPSTSFGLRTRSNNPLEAEDLGAEIDRIVQDEILNLENSDIEEDDASVSELLGRQINRPINGRRRPQRVRPARRPQLTQWISQQQRRRRNQDKKRRNQIRRLKRTIKQLLEVVQNCQSNANIFDLKSDKKHPSRIEIVHLGGHLNKK